MELLTRMGVSATSVRSVTIKIFNEHGEKSEAVVNGFIAHNWSGYDLTCLVRESAHSGWRKDPQVLFEIEAAMISCGLPPKDIRDFLIERPCVSESDPLTVRRAIAAFLEVGHGANEIMQFVKNRPRILFASPDWIRQWHSVNVAQNRHASAHLHALLKAPRERPPSPEPKPLSPQDRPPLIRKPLPAALLKTSAVQPRILRPAQAPKPPPAIPVRVRTSPVRIERDDLADDEGSRDDGPVPATHERNWKKEIQTVLKLTDDQWYAEHWAEFEKNSAWMWDRTGPAPAILDHFAFWLSMSEIQHKDSPAMQFMAKLLKTTTYHHLLRLSPTALQHRLAAIRAIVDRNFLVDTELLLLRWERVSPTELRYRVHEIEARGKVANRAPYLIMLVEPTREEFLARLNRYV